MSVPATVHRRNGTVIPILGGAVGARLTRVELPEVQQLVGSVVLEAFDESVGVSRRKWALVLVAFIAGAVTFWMIRRRRKAHEAQEGSVPVGEAAS